MADSVVVVGVGRLDGRETSSGTIINFLSGVSYLAPHFLNPRWGFSRFKKILTEYNLATTQVDVVSMNPNCTISVKWKQLPKRHSQP